MNFEIEKALEYERTFHDTNSLEQGNVKATLYKTNQVLLLDIGEAEVLTHDKENHVAIINVLEGSVVLEYASKSETLTANTDSSSAFDVKTPYKLIANQNSKVLLLARNLIQ